jgi:hypothetical protein
MNLKSGEAMVLIIRRSETQPTNYFFAVRKSESSFNKQSNDFQLHGGQESVLEVSKEIGFPVARETAISAIRELQP